MSGQAGVRAPDIATAALADPDNGDDVFGAGDTLTITFDAPTNKAGSGLLSEAGGKAYVDELFSFSHSLGARYHGRWRDASVFVVTMVDTGGHAIPASLGGATVAVVGDIKTSNELSRWCKAVTPLSGNTGTQAAPTIAAFDAHTWDLHDAGWSHHDTITIRFDRPTDRGGRQGGKGFVDTTISFSQPLGADYSGTWRDASTFVVTVLDASGAGDGPRVNGTSGALVSIASQLYNSPRTSSPSSSSYRMQSGDFGDAAASRRACALSTWPTPTTATRLTTRATRSSCSSTAPSLRRAVSRPRPRLTTAPSARRASGGVEFVDSLVTLSSPIGANYSGGWRDASSLVITVLEPYPRAEHAPRPYDTVLRVPASANITNLAGTRSLSNSARSSWGSPSASRWRRRRRAGRRGRSRLRQPRSRAGVGIRSRSLRLADRPRQRRVRWPRASVVRSAVRATSTDRSCCLFDFFDADGTRITALLPRVLERLARRLHLRRRPQRHRRLQPGILAAL